MQEKNRVRALLLTLPLAAAACTGRLAGEDLIVKSWQGGRAEDIVVAWGQPARVVNLSDGRKVLSWGEQAHALSTAHEPVTGSIALGPLKDIGTPGFIRSTGVRNDYLQESTACIRNIVVAPAGEITGGEARGSSCCMQASRGDCAALLRRNPAP